MICLGLRLRDLGSRKLSWRDLYVVVNHGPESSALYRAKYPDESAWGIPEHLAAAMVDALRTLVWMKTEDGAKGRNRPKPVDRPGLPPDQDVTRFGSDPEPIDDIRAWLGWP